MGAVNEGYNKKMTIDDVAEILGVSKTTVSRAISGKGRIGAETREKVLRFIEENNYNPNALAKGLAQSKTYNIAVAIPEDYNLVDLPFFQNSLMGIMQMTEQVNYDVLLAMVKPNDISQLTRIIDNRKADGIILARTYQEDMAADYLMEQGIPFVVMGSSENEQIMQVDNNHVAACRELTTILLAKGMKRLALIGGDEAHVVTANRCKGYELAHQDMKLQADRSIIYLNATNGSYVTRIGEELLKKRIDGIICMDDNICAMLLNFFNSQDIIVPQDIKLASFYYSTLLENSIPTITSVKFNETELGYKACVKLIDILKGKEVEPKSILSYEINLRESTK